MYLQNEKMKSWYMYLVCICLSVPESGTEILAARDEGGASGGVPNVSYSSVMSCEL